MISLSKTGMMSLTTHQNKSQLLVQKKFYKACEPTGPKLETLAEQHNNSSHALSTIEVRITQIPELTHWGLLTFYSF